MHSSRPFQIIIKILTSSSTSASAKNGGLRKSKVRTNPVFLGLFNRYELPFSKMNPTQTNVTFGPWKRHLSVPDLLHCIKSKLVDSDNEHVEYNCIGVRDDQFDRIQSSIADVLFTHWPYHGGKSWLNFYSERTLTTIKLRSPRCESYCQKNRTIWTIHRTGDIATMLTPCVRCPGANLALLWVVFVASVAFYGDSLSLTFAFWLFINTIVTLHWYNSLYHEHVCRGPGVNNLAPSANGRGFEPRMAHFFFHFFSI